MKEKEILKLIKKYIEKYGTAGLDMAPPLDHELTEFLDGMAGYIASTMEQQDSIIERARLSCDREWCRVLCFEDTDTIERITTRLNNFRRHGYFTVTDGSYEKKEETVKC